MPRPLCAGWTPEPPNLEEAGRRLVVSLRTAIARATSSAGSVPSSRRRRRGRKRWTINEAIREVIALLRGEVVEHGVSVQTQLAEDLPLIQGDRVQLQQVILNLIINAIEAMSGVSEGPRELLISTGRAEPDGVFVAVRDTGPGWRRRFSSAFRGLLHDQAEWFGHGPVDLPLDHRSAWGTIVGERECPPRRSVYLYGAC